MADFLGTIKNGTIQSFKETASSPAIASNVLTLDLSNGSVFTVTHDANVNTVAISNPVSSNSVAVQALTLVLLYTATAYTITWGASIKWPSGTPPTLTAGVGKIDIFTFVSYNGGSTWFGFVGGQNY